MKYRILRKLCALRTNRIARKLDGRPYRLRDRVVVAALNIPIHAIIDRDMRQIGVFLDRMTGKNLGPLEQPFIYLDDAVTCEDCGESVSPTSLLPCKCVREMQEADHVEMIRRTLQ